MDSYKVELTRSAEKDLRRIDKRYIPRIFAVVESLESEPRPVGSKKLSGSEHTYRIRVGTYRVIYDIEDDCLKILVIKIGHRRDVYQ
ncbi:MAG: type II toxin-antitoxin system RelE/ParE family toxin [Verrucomicrobiae bacterium]|nr:type II toxin-antitoxin system RelE/ParE family toxin [Verrucomicrobiae bacterium]NNJ43848.1 type II toxin-antitoxin system RelE/ParE family toxin [Akkermansiaceae bacterium]